MTAGGRATKRDYLFPVSVLFRGKVLAALDEAYRAGVLDLRGVAGFGGGATADDVTWRRLKRKRYRTKWVSSSIFDAARWPATIFRGALRVVFTFIIPLAVMTTYPAEALLGRLELSTLLATILGAATFAAAARFV